MSRPYDVMIAGHVCFDIIPRFPDTGAKTMGEIMRPGKLVQMDAVTMSTGGPVSNTGIGLKLLGNNVCFNARTGEDEIGRLTMDYLQRSGNAAGIHAVPGSSSSYTVVIAPPGIDRIFLHHPGTNNEYSADDLDPALISQCKHFHFGYPPLMRRMFENEGRELQRVFQIAKEAGATTSCDMALPDPASVSGKAPWAKILANILPYVDVYLPSAEETFYMLEPEAFLSLKEHHQGADLIDFMTPDDYGRLSGKLLDLGCKMTSMKSGHRGYYFRTGNKKNFDGMGAARPGDADNWSDRELWCPAFAAPNLASATGSGDSSIAGFITGFLRGLTLEETLKYANILGWQNVQTLDALSGIGSWEDSGALLAKKMPMIDVHIDAPGWTWREALGLWSGPRDSKL